MVLRNRFHPIENDTYLSAYGRRHFAYITRDSFIVYDPSLHRQLLKHPLKEYVSTISSTAFTSLIAGEDEFFLGLVNGCVLRYYSDPPGSDCYFMTTFPFHGGLAVQKLLGANTTWLAYIDFGNAIVIYERVLNREGGFVFSNRRQWWLKDEIVTSSFCRNTGKVWTVTKSVRRAPPLYVLHRSDPETRTTHSQQITSDYRVVAVSENGTMAIESEGRIYFNMPRTAVSQQLHGGCHVFFATHGRHDFLFMCSENQAIIFTQKGKCCDLRPPSGERFMVSPMARPGFDGQGRLVFRTKNQPRSCNRSIERQGLLIVPLLSPEDRVVK